MEIMRDKVTELEFKLNLEGNTGEPEVALIAELGSYKMSFPGKIQEDTATVNIPALKDILKSIPESTNLRLEVMVDGAFFVPWEESATFKKSVTVEAVVKNSTPEKPKSKPSVQLTETPKVVREHKFVEDIQPPKKKKKEQPAPSSSAVSEFIKSLREK